MSEVEQEKSHYIMHWLLHTYESFTCDHYRFIEADFAGQTSSSETPLQYTNLADPFENFNFFLSSRLLFSSLLFLKVGYYFHFGCSLLFA